MAENWPRVTSILKDFGVISDAWYFEPRHRRRGRLCDAACNLLGQGIKIEDEWWEQCSGVRDDDRVFHHEVRPFVAAYSRFLRETGFKLHVCAKEVKNSVDRVIGHFDQLGEFPEIRLPMKPALLDIKTGGESEWHKLQLGFYQPAIFETLGVLVDRYNLYLTDDGKYRLQGRPDRRDIIQAKYLAQAWWVLHEYGVQSQA